MNTKTVLPLMLILFSGCTSFRTTVMQRATDSRFYPNCPVAKTNGIPVKLKVPTHLQVEIVESFFIAKNDQDVNKPRYFEPRIILNDKQIRALQVQTKVVYTDKVFTVDFRRPAGGILNLSSATFDEEQYFKAIAANYEEQTLQQINQALTTLKTGEAGKPISTGGDVQAPEVAKDGNSEPKVKAGLRTVAMTRFDISEPDWEWQLQCFVEKHVTQCYPDCKYAE